MVELSGQEELSEQRAELLVACITKLYAVCACRSHRRSIYIAKRRFIFSRKCSNDYSACFYC